MKKRIISMCLALALMFAMLPQISISSNAAQADEILFEMREEVIEFRLSDGTLYYTNTISYPYFLGNTAAEIKINNKYSAFIEECRSNTTDFDALYQEVLKWSPDGVNGLPFYDNVTANVMYSSNGIISIKECSTMWSGGMHPYSDYLGYTYLISDGSELLLSDILVGSDAEISNLINLHKQGIVDYFDAEIIMASPFVLTDEGLCFMCNVGDAIPRAEIVIPYTNQDSYVISAGNETEGSSADNSDNFENTSQSQKTDEEINVINALNSLLVGVRYYPDYLGSDVAKWTDEAICDVIYGKLLWDDYSYSDRSYLGKIGLEYWSGNDWYWHFDLDLVNRITQGTLGRDFPTNTHSENIFVSGDELLIMPAFGESSSLRVQQYTKQGNMVIAIGTAAHNYNAHSEFLGYFQAVFEEIESSIYGYTLHSLSSIESNQDFGELTASASSELKETTITHYAENVLDRDLETAWVEGVRGVGINEWIKLETVDGSSMYVSAIQFSMGYQKNDQLLHKNGWPHKVLIEADGGYRQEAKFYDYTDIVLLDQAVTTSWIKITILEASAGSKYDDTCISEISMLGIDTAAFFEKYVAENPIQNIAELKVYTTFPYATLGIDQTAKLLITLLVNGEPTPMDGFSLANSNTEVIDLVDTKDADGVRVLTFMTKSPGVANLTFTEGATGATVSVEIAVEEMCNYYRCSNFPIPDASSFPIHVAGFQCTENSDGTHNVKFNAYNTSYAYGTAVVYDETGAFWSCVPLNPKYDGTGMEYIANGFWQSWEQTWYWIDGDKEFYEVAGNAMLTEVEFNNIPQNAKIVITADGRESVYPILYTGIDIFLKVAFYSANIDLKTNVYQKSVKEFVVALLKALPDDTAQNTIQTLTTDISMALIDGINSESVEKIYQAVWNMFENLGLNADEMLKDVLAGLGYSVADTVVIAAVPAYSFVDLVNKIVAVTWLFVDYDSNLDRGKMEIHCVEHASNNQLVNSSVVVIQQNAFSKDTILDAYVVTDAEELGNLPDSVTSDIENYSVYNITLLENGAEVQPGEEIEISVPIPENVNPNKCVIYRLEEDGTLTLLPSKTENGYIVFTTTHLSYYIVGESTEETAEDISTDSENNGAWIWIACGVVTIGVIMLIIIMKRKKSNA